MAHILVIGSGGREHTIAWKLTQSEKVVAVTVAPGNAGTSVANDASHKLSTPSGLLDTNPSVLLCCADTLQWCYPVYLLVADVRPDGLVVVIDSQPLIDWYIISVVCVFC